MRISDWSSDVCSSDLPLDSRTFATEYKNPARPGLRAGSARSAYPFYIDQTILHHDTDDSHMLGDVVHRGALQVQPPAPAKITMQHETAAVTHQRPGFLDPVADPSHPATAHVQDTYACPQHRAPRPQVT